MNMNKAEAYKKKKLKGSELKSNKSGMPSALGSSMDIDGKITFLEIYWYSTYLGC